MLTRRQRLFRFGSASVVAVLGLCTSRAAQAGNDEAVLIGRQAALTGAAVTSIVEDGTAAWYNPAGLAHVERNSFDVTGSVYGFSSNSVDDLLTLSDGTSSDARYTDWLLVPSALSFARKMNEKLVASFGLFIPRASDFDIRTSVESTTGALWVFRARDIRNEYNYTLSVAGRTSDRFRWGVSVYGVYVSETNFLVVSAGFPGQAGAPQANVTVSGTYGYYGLRLGFGVQADVSSRVTLGATLLSPTLSGFRDVAETNILSVVPEDGEQGEWYAEDDAGLQGEWDLIAPIKLRAGAAIALGEHKLLLDGDVAPPLRHAADGKDYTWNGNARVAGLFTVNETIRVGAGLFTDRAPYREDSADFYGLAFGLTAFSNHRTDHGRQLTFTTTVGGRYAYGNGRTTGARFTQTADDFAVELTSVRFSSHELAGNLVSGVYF